MKTIAYVNTDATQSFGRTLETTLRDIEKHGHKIVNIQIFSDSQGVNGSTHSAYIIYDTRKQVRVKKA